MYSYCHINISFTPQTDGGKKRNYAYRKWVSRAKYILNLKTVTHLAILLAIFFP